MPALSGEPDLTNLDQDFGYTADVPGGVTGTVWNDVNADGTLNEPVPDSGLEGVTVVLLDPDGNVVATTTTNPDGTYDFPNLPPGNYVVDVTDDDNVLAGMWHTLGTPDTPGESQTDPYPVTVPSGAPVVVDFGYYDEPAALGNFVWYDLNNDGIQDGGEPGIGGVPVTLTITYPNGDILEVVTVTDATGHYDFGVLLDEAYTQSDGTAATRQYAIAFEQLVGLVPTDQVPGDGTNDSKGLSVTVAALEQGEIDDVYDSGFKLVRQDLGDLPF